MRGVPCITNEMLHDFAKSDEVPLKTALDHLKGG